MDISADFPPGKAVCVTGIGGDAMVHSHSRVERHTKTLIILTNGNRYRRDGGSSVPYAAYGGTSISVTCTRPRRPRQ